MRKDDAIIHAVLHWQGGDHTQLQVKQRLNAAGRHNPRIPEDAIALVRELARLMPDRQIAGRSIALASRPGTAMPGRKSACAASVIITTSPSSATVSGQSAVRLRSRRQQNSSASAA
ncbi:hypothetical protein [Bradyrhizobium sp. 143]|uniref:hypothetical protein n=1 Tax=Bradyrhizobium sp. 143 TaxID=2782619 RepID=UPI001FF7B889|nr:hypothetical protein [Bradyrhizobium sp. 143]